METSASLGSADNVDVVGIFLIRHWDKTQHLGLNRVSVLCSQVEAFLRQLQTGVWKATGGQVALPLCWW